MSHRPADRSAISVLSTYLLRALRQIGCARSARSVLSRVLARLLAVVLAAGLVTVAASVAQAAPLPADYSASTSGDVVSVGLDAVGLDTLDAAVGHSATTVDSTGTPRSRAESANVAANAVGIGVGVEAAVAESTNATPDDTYNQSLGQVDVPGVLDTGLVSGTGQTHWASDSACVPDGDPIAQSTTTLAGATLGLPGLQILDLGTVSTTGSTSLDDGSVVATSSGNLADSSLLNGLVGIHVVNQPEITAQSNGTTGTVTSNDYAVDVTVGNAAPVRLVAGGQIPINLTVPGVAATDLTLTVGNLNDASAGATGEGNMSFITITGTIDLLGANAVTVDLGLLPLTAAATAPTGGVECDSLAAPVISRPADGSTTGDTTPTIGGTGTPGATVTVTEAGTTIGTADVDNDGTWSLVPDTPLDLGSHTIVATQANGQATSPASDPDSFQIIDTTAPDPPIITDPADGSSTNDTTPPISGTAEPGSTVAVSVDGNQIGTTRANGDGNWTLVPPTPLAPGGHTATATATDAAGNTSDPSDPVDFTIDTTAPAAPVITQPADGSTTTDNTPAITGTGEPGATVTVSVDGDQIGTATVNGDGSWTLNTPDPLADGDHTVSATQTDPAGNTSDADSVDFTVDATTQTPVITRPADGSSTRDTTPTISGTAEPGATVVVTDQDGTQLGTATTNSNGNWTFTSTALTPGGYTITATATDPSGNRSGRSHPDRFTIDTTAPAPPVITRPADGSTVTDNTPTIGGSGEPGATVTVSVDGDQIGTTTVNGDGGWTIGVAQPLGDGDHTVTATQTDPAGNTSGPSDPVDFTIDATPPAAPTIVTPRTGPPSPTPHPPSPALVNPAPPSASGSTDTGSAPHASARTAAGPARLTSPSTRAGTRSPPSKPTRPATPAIRHGPGSP
ncbi:hypothetical protein GCM10027613_19710 [Microlunatus endophyticus]